MSSKFWLSQEDFNAIYSKVPRLNVDLVILTDKGEIVLAKRSILPSIGSWHLPGGTVYKTERIEDAAKRIAKKETGFDIKVVRPLGYIESPHEQREFFEMHSISIPLLVEIVGGELHKNADAKEIGFFKEPFPEPLLPEQKIFLRNNNFIS
jgi:colanic acid biosynthesis protein WcaH